MNAKVTIAALIVVAATAGCEDSRKAIEPLDATSEFFEPEIAQGRGVASIEYKIALRQAEYDSIISEARARGAIGGALRGGLIGILLSGSPEMAAAGALFGAAVGTSISERLTTDLIREHKNYLIRSVSLDMILAAAKDDTAKTNFDLLLAKEYTKQTFSKSSFSGETVNDIAKQTSMARLEEFREHARLRAVTLREILPMYQSEQKEYEILLTNLERQVNLISEMSTELSKLEANL